MLGREIRPSHAPGQLGHPHIHAREGDPMSASTQRFLSQDGNVPRDSATIIAGESGQAHFT